MPDILKYLKQRAAEGAGEAEALTRYANELTGADDPDLISAAETMIHIIKEDN